MTIQDETADDIGALVRAAAQAARRAGRALLAGAGTDARGKPGGHAHDVVTEADTAVEEMLRAELTAACPGSAVVGEEGGADGDGEVLWYVDPIDGTHNFSRGLPLYCVSIGLTVRGEPVGGCVYEPARDELHTAAGNVLLRDGRAVEPPPPRPVPMVLADLPRAGTAPDPAEFALFAELLAAADVRRIGSSALALAYVATGRADMAVVPDALAWDHAAGRVLVTASGGAFVAVPEGPCLRRPGAFAAWRPGLSDLGATVVRALERMPFLRGWLEDDTTLA
ncbi:inositol monophosphatase family protein [Actinomadura kijaniata]|uniref:inositol monophosphatase family protein n=1 Tax=Actinomadura kijaniata TaxID=46161 RepID=UPI000829C396|nr:inositol monophosphatase [Actinomadura kijaniata]